MILRRAGIVFRNGLLVFRQHIYSKPLLGVQVGVSAGPMVDANQHQRRIERNRSKGIGGHPLHLALVVHGNDSHSGRKTSQSLRNSADVTLMRTLESLSSYITLKHRSVGKTERTFGQATAFPFPASCIILL